MRITLLTAILALFGGLASAADATWTLPRCREELFWDADLIGLFEVLEVREKEEGLLGRYSGVKLQAGEVYKGNFVEREGGNTVLLLSRAAVVGQKFIRFLQKAEQPGSTNWFSPLAKEAGPWEARASEYRLPREEAPALRRMARAFAEPERGLSSQEAQERTGSAYFLTRRFIAVGGWCRGARADPRIIPALLSALSSPGWETRLSAFLPAARAAPVEAMPTPPREAAPP